MSGPVMIMAGGTGGHVIPALAVARALKSQARQVVWLGTRNGLEARLVPAADIEIEWIQVRGLRGAGWRRWLVAPIQLMHALWQSLAAVRRRKPALVLGMGGFVSGPGGIAAWLLRRPLIIHEQNAIAGMTNRLLARFAREVYEAFPGSFPQGVRARHVGNPVRPEIVALESPESRLAGREGAIRLLVFGGSQGSLSLNQEVPGSLARLQGRCNVEVWHQAGERTLALAEQAYRDAGISVRLDSYIDDMAGAYRWADLVICRAGALTVAELAAAGLASILVPFAAAVDDHQTRNARYLCDAGAAALISESSLRSGQLDRLLLDLAGSRQRLLAMAVAARGLAKPHALQALVSACVAAGDWRADS